MTQWHICFENGWIFRSKDVQAPIPQQMVWMCICTVWLHKLGSGYTSWGLATQVGVWLHKLGAGYTSWGLATQVGVWLHKLGSGYTSTGSGYTSTGSGYTGGIFWDTRCRVMYPHQGMQQLAGITSMCHLVSNAPAMHIPVWENHLCHTLPTRLN